MDKHYYYRIRLEPVGDNIYESKTIFISNKNGGQYKVIVNMDTMQYKIRNVKQYILVRNSEKAGKKPVKTKRALYARIKRDLISLGVEFKYDFRGL